MPALGSVPRYLTGTPGRVVAQVAVLSAVVAGTVAYADSGSTFSLSVDGQAREVRADVSTVRALLADEGVTVSERDLVAPALDSAIHEGQQVVVRYARPLNVTVDGEQRTFWTTELVVDNALAAMGIRADDARLSVSRSQPLGRDGLALTVSTPKSVRLALDGDTRTVTTTAPTVADLFAEQHVTLDADDIASAATSTPVVDGLTVTVTRIATRTLTVTEPVGFSTTQTKDATLTVGQKKVVTAGKAGSRRATYTVTLADGKETKRALVTSEVLIEPVDAVVRVGSKPKPASTTGTGFSAGASVDSLNWPALAKCESGGNPKAVNPAGYYGLYQFSLSTWRSVGGSGNPINASPAEQLMRAKILYKKAGAGQWGCGRHLFD